MVPGVTSHHGSSWGGPYLPLQLPHPAAGLGRLPEAGGPSWLEEHIVVRAVRRFRDRTAELLVLAGGVGSSTQSLGCPRPPTDVDVLLARRECALGRAIQQQLNGGPTLLAEGVS